MTKLPQRDPASQARADTLAARLRQLRDDSGLTQREVAELLRPHGIECTRSLWGKWERGQSMPRAADAPVIAETLGVEIWELFG